MTPVYERYAEALYKASENLGCTEAVACELLALEEIIIQCDECLNNPLIGEGEKAPLLRALFVGKVTPLTLELILLMAARRHLKHFRPAAQQFLRLGGYDETVVRLRIPFVPDKDLLEQLKRCLTKEKLIPADARNARFDIIEDKELIGGFIASCNGYQIDTSLRTTLMRLLGPERLVHSDN